MNCRQARTTIALCVGEDLAGRQQREELKRHLAACPPCRDHYRQLKKTIRVLENADRDPTYDAADSLWPQLANRIQQQQTSRFSKARFNGWPPFVAMTAACALLIVAMQWHTPQPGAISVQPQNYHKDVLPFPVLDRSPRYVPEVTISPVSTNLEPDTSNRRIDDDEVEDAQSNNPNAENAHF